MLIRITVFLTAIALVTVLADTFRLRFGSNHRKRLKDFSNREKVKSTGDISLLKDDNENRVINLAFRLPSSNWFYLTISHNGRHRTFNFGTGKIEPAG